MTLMNVKLSLIDRLIVAVAFPICTCILPYRCMCMYIPFVVFFFFLPFVFSAYVREGGK